MQIINSRSDISLVALTDYAGCRRSNEFKPQYVKPVPRFAQNAWSDFRAYWLRKNKLSIQKATILGKRRFSAHLWKIFSRKLGLLKWEG